MYNVQIILKQRFEMKNFILMIFVACIMSGCSIMAKTKVPDKVIFDDDKVIIYGGDKYNNRGDKYNNRPFCPPGQAKKGGC